MNESGREAAVIFDYYDANKAVVSIHAPTRDEIRIIRGILSSGFSYYNEKLAHTWEAKEGLISVTEYIFEKNSQTIPIGLIPRACRYLNENYPSVKIRLSPKIREMFVNPFGEVTNQIVKDYITTLNCRNENGDAIIPYDHQLDIVTRALMGRRISVMACTSAGKSLCIMVLARWLLEKELRKVLIITPSSQLVEQLYTDFYDDYGWKDAANKVTLIHGSSRDKLSAKTITKLNELGLGEEAMLKQITISTWQSLQNKDPEFFLPFTAVIVDEAHGTRGPVLRDILDKCINSTSFKIGLSGTLPDDGLDAAWIEGALGRKEEVVRLKHLIARKILTPIQIISMRVPVAKEQRPKICSSQYKEEYTVLTNCDALRPIVDLMIENDRFSKQQNTLILFKSIEHLELLMEYVVKKYPEYRCHKVIGDISPDDRNKIRKEIETSLGNIIFATYGTFKQGVNIKLLHNLMFAEWSKSMYEVVQAIGRVVRKHPNKSQCFVYDMFFDASYYTKPRGKGFPKFMQNYSVKHYQVRNMYYRADDIPVTEFGLETIFEAKVDFSLLEESKKKAASKLKKTKQAPVVGDLFDFE